MGRLKIFFLRKTGASSLTEVLVATTVLLVVFAIAIITLNNLMRSSVQKSTQVMDAKIEKLIYQYKNKQLKIPERYKEDNFLISIQQIKENQLAIVEFSITNISTKKHRVKKQIANAEN